MIERAEIGLGLEAGADLRAFSQCPLDGGHEPSGQPVFQHEIGCAIFQHLHRGLFADRARDDEDWHLRAKLGGDDERQSAVEGRQVVVGEDDLGAELPDGALEFRPGLRTLDNELDPASPEFARDQFRIEVRILEEENPQAVIFLGVHGVLMGGWFSTSQYRPKLLTASEKFSNSTGFTM